MGRTNSFLALTCAASCALLHLSQNAIAADAASATFPTKQITLVVPYPAGGGNDIIARTLKAHWEKVWGKPVIVENKPGGNGIIGTQFVAKAPADGHTLLMEAWRRTRSIRRCIRHLT